jgi:hypothetical protein
MRTMKALSAAFLVTLSVTTTAGDVTATTERGEKVILSSDGTWKPIKEKAAGAQTSYKKPIGATAEYQTLVPQYSLMYNSDQWTQDKTEGNGAQQRFLHKNGAIYGMVIAERLPLNLEAAKKIALYNAQKAAPDVQVVMEEKRVVNGVEMIAMQLSGSIQEVPFTYLGNYYGDKSGVIQVICFTVTPAFKDREQDCLNFINGLVIKTS